MEYRLKHRDDSVCELTIDETGNIIKTGRIFDEKLLPLGGNLSVQELKKWWQRRAVPVTQTGIVTFLQKIDKTNTEFLTDNFGLSMTDHYWICPIGKEQEFQWEHVNFFQNPFEELTGPEKTGFETHCSRTALYEETESFLIMKDSYGNMLSTFEQEGENMSTKIESRHQQALRYAMEKISRSPLAPYVNELYLYGSYARGTQTWESDVDLLLTLDGNAPNLKKEIIKLKAEVSQDGIDDVQVDLKVLYGDAWKTSQMLYYQNIRREGKKLW